jgi:hypothetical protein
LKPSSLTCYKQFGTNSIIVLMFVESQRCTYRAPVRYVTKTWSVVLLNKKIRILLSQVYCVCRVVKTQQSFVITLYICPVFSLWYALSFEAYINNLECFSSFQFQRIMFIVSDEPATVTKMSYLLQI